MARHTRWITVLLLCCFTWALTGCGNGGGDTDSPDKGTTANVAGAAQKGPFQPGGSATASRLNADGTAASESVSTVIGTNGAYDLTGIDWSGPTQIEVSGTYYDEISGNFTSSPETLYALVNVPGETRANINLFTHLVAARAIHLMNGGAAFADARDQARSELATIMGNGAPPPALNLLAANSHEDDGANLLLFSAALLSTGDAAAALDAIAADFADDGHINGAGVAAFESVQNVAIADPDLLSSARTTLQNQYGTTPPKNTDNQPPGWLPDDTAPAPEAAFTTDGPLRVGENQSFDARGSTGNGLSYAWDFGDGGSSTDAMPTHVFAAEGSYTVTLTVTDSNDQADTASQTLAITAADQPPAPPVAAFTVDGNQTSGATLTFNADGSSGSSLTYSWDFGDGATAAGAQATHAFAAAGSYTVTLTVTDSANHTDTASGNIEITAAGPEAAFSVSGAGQAGQPQSFDASASSGTGPIYHWDFGDGDAGNGAQIVHVYDSAASYNVTLTVTGDNGNDSASQSVTIDAAAEQPAATDGTIGGKVTDSTGQPLADVQVALVNGQTLVGGSRSETTNVDGQVDLTGMPTGVEFVLELSKYGYAAQFVRTIIPDGTTDAVFKAALIERGPAQTWIAVESGGTKTGGDGVSITLPPNALVDANGNPVAGNVEVSLTPVNVSNDAELASFPGSFTAYNNAGDRGLMLSYGVAEFHITQGGEELQIAPGKQATLLIPIYVSKHKDGTPVTVGDTIPLWSLDETTGQWIQEGSGTVVSNSASPTGMAFEIKVGHLSWYNCDAFDNPYRPIPKCTISSSSGVPTLDLSETCYIDGYIAGDGPRTIVNTNVPAAGGVPLPVPSGVDYVLMAVARNGTLSGSVTVNGTAGAQEVVEIVLNRIDDGAADGQPITLPYDDPGIIDTVGHTDYYQFSGQAGQIVLIQISPSTGSTLEGQVELATAAGQSLGIAEIPPEWEDRPGAIAARLPADGDYHLSIVGTANAPGGYRLRASIVPEISIDQNLEGTLPQGETIYRAFEGTVGTVVGARNIAYQYQGSEASVTILTSDGNELFGFQERFAALPADGMYILEINGSSNGARYRTAVARIEPPQMLSFDSAGRDTVSADIQVYGDRQYYKFNATDNAGLYISVDQSGSTPLTSKDTVLAVYEAQGSFFGVSAREENSAGYSPDPDHVNDLGMRLYGDEPSNTFLISLQASGAGVFGDYTLRVDTATAGDTIVVDDDLQQCPNADTRSVHAAAYAVTDGGTIDVCNGRYAEHSAISPEAEGISIIGRNRAAVILSTNERGGKVVDLGRGTLDSVQNLTIRGKGKTDSGFNNVAELGNITNVTLNTTDDASGTGNLLVDQDGAIIDGLVFTGHQIRVEADDTIIRNSDITVISGSVGWGSYNINSLFENNTVTMNEGGSLRLTGNPTGSLKLLDNDITITADDSDAGFYGGPSIYLLASGLGDTGIIIRGNTLNISGQDGLEIRVTDGRSGDFASAVVEQNLFQFTGTEGGSALKLSNSSGYNNGGNFLVRNNVFDGYSTRRDGALGIYGANLFANIDIINNTWRAAAPDTETTCTSVCPSVKVNGSYGFTGAFPVRFINNILIGWASDGTTDTFAVETSENTSIDSNNNLFGNFDSLYRGGGTSTGTSDIDLGLVPPGDPGFTGHHLEIDGLSPAVNSGQAPMAGGAPIPEKDYDGTLRPQGSTWDIGAHEWTAP